MSEPPKEQDTLEDNSTITPDDTIIPDDPTADWGNLNNKIKLQRLLTLGYVWGIIAMAIGFFVFMAYLLDWI